MKEPCDLLIKNASELVTCRSGGRPKTGAEAGNVEAIKGGSLVVRGDKIAFVGSGSEVEEAFIVDDRTKVVDASEKLVLPGFVDAHTHVVFAGWREDEFARRLKGETYEQILRASGGIYRTVQQTRSTPGESLLASARTRLQTMLRHGSTTVEAKSGYGLTLLDELKCLGVIRSLVGGALPNLVSTFLGAHVVAPEFHDNVQGYVDYLIHVMMPEVWKRKLAEFCDVFCDPSAFSLADSRKVLTSAKKLGFHLKVHADEFADSGGALLASELGAVSADHLLHISESSFKALAQSGVVAVLLPATPFSLSLGKYAPARQLIDAGVPVALGTDFSPLTVTESMQMVISLACVMMRMTPAEALVAATINSACAVGRGHFMGSLEVGKLADAVVLDVPNHDHLGYRYGRNLVTCVVKGGRIVYETV